MTSDEQSNESTGGPLSAEQRAEVEATRAESSQTHRVTVSALEEILYHPTPVLDHGFVRVIDYMGDDSAVVQAARVSYGRGTKRASDDAGLIRYLMRNRHTTPFEMCEIKFHVKLPIFVARQWIRHRTASVNEYSARYSVLDREFYVPDADKLGVQSSANRQARNEPEFYQLGLGDLATPVKGERGSGDVLQGREAKVVLNLLRADANRAYDHYEDMLNEDAEGAVRDPKRRGLARELARMNLSLNFYTQWYWKIDLHNLMHFLQLRADDHAQYEIRAYAHEMLKMLKLWVPLTYEAFDDYRQGGASLSRQGLDVVRRMLRNEPVKRADTDLTVADWRELMTLLGR